MHLESVVMAATGHVTGESNMRPSADRATGGTSLPGGKFLGMHEVITMLTQCKNALPSIPPGLKENVYFLVDNRKNAERRAEGRPSVFCDDCGAWSHNGTSGKYLLLRKENGQYCGIFDKRRDGLGYCIKKKRDKKVAFASLDPQPDPDKIIVIRRYYTELKSCETYKRRITWIETADITESCCVDIVEYTGSYPGPRPHGNRRHTTKPYCRVDPDEKIQNIKKPRINARNPVRGEPKSTRKKPQTGSTKKKKNVLVGASSVESAFSPVQPYPVVQDDSTLDNGNVTQIVVYTDGDLSDFEHIYGDPAVIPGLTGSDQTLNMDPIQLASAVANQLDQTQAGSTDQIMCMDSTVGSSGAGNPDGATWILSPTELARESEKAANQSLLTVTPRSTQSKSKGKFVYLSGFELYHVIECN